MRAPYGAMVRDRMEEQLLRISWNSPQKRRSPAQAATCNRADFVNGNTRRDTSGEASAARAIAFATRRASALDRTADLLLSIGRHTAAERLSHIAAELREVTR